jgi:hypothetical protein
MSHLDQSQIDKAVFDFIGSIRLSADWSSLSEAQRTIALVYAMECEVCNGGIHQFFVNPSGDKWAETVDALRRIGASKITNIFGRALAVFPKSQPSPDHLVRGAQLAAAGERAHKLLEELTDEYYALYEIDPGQDLYARMAAFLIEQGLSRAVSE